MSGPDMDPVFAPVMEVTSPEVIAASRQAYQSILDKAQILLPQPRFRDLLAGEASINPKNFYHELRCWETSGVVINCMERQGLISADERSVAIKQSLALITHDECKNVISPDGHKASQELMDYKPPVANLNLRTHDPRPPEVFAAHGSHAVWGEKMFIYLSEDGLSSVPKKTIDIFKRGAKDHHSFVGEIVSDRGPKVSYADSPFISDESMSSITNPEENGVDLVDAMSNFRLYRGEGSWKVLDDETIISELRNHLPDERILSSFRCSPRLIDRTRETFINILMAAPKELAILKIEPDPHELKWNRKDLIQPGDEDFYDQIGAELWSKYRDEVMDFRDRLAETYFRLQERQQAA